MVIDPKTEAPLRKILGHAIRHEMGELADLVAAEGGEMYVAGLKLCVPACGYIVIDVAGRWPLDADLREAARRAAKSATDLPVTEDDIYIFLSRVVFGFEAIDTVFADPEKVIRIPLFTAANLLSKFSPGEMHWFEYLDQVWNAIEEAEQARTDVLPALTYRVRAEAAGAKG